MGLDLIVEACAKPGHEAEWRGLLERAFKGEDSDIDKERFEEISIPAYQRLDAPRVGYDSAADAWIIEAREAATPEEIAAVLKEFHGHYALRLVKSDGVPDYSHGGLYDGADETSFRGSFLDFCGDVLDKALLRKAYDDRFPEAAVEYGQALLAAAKQARSSPPPPPKRGLLSRLGLTKSQPTPLEDQLDIVEAAARWFIFWGERGHAIRAWV